MLNQETVSQPTNNGPNSPDSAYGQLVRDLYALMQRDPRYNLPAYDVWEPTIVGGLSGAYQLLTTFDTTCEYRILYLAATDSTQCYIGKLPNFAAPTSATTIGGVAGSTTPTPDRGVFGVVLTAAANVTTPGPDEWLPFGPQDVLTIQLTVANSHAAWVGVLFRRRRQPSGVWIEGSS